jgi:putative transposase
MKTVADTLGVARSNLATRRAKPAHPRGPYRKPQDQALLPTIRAIVDARLTLLPDAQTVIRLLPGWFEDYNTVHPHSGLRMLSPREFLRLSA